MQYDIQKEMKLLTQPGIHFKISINSGDTHLPIDMNNLVNVEDKDRMQIYTETITEFPNFRSTIPTLQNSTNYKLLQQYFEKNIKKNKYNLENIKKEFNRLAAELHELPFKNLDVEITNLNSLRISLIFENNLLLVISKPLESIIDMDQNQVLFSLFQNRQMIASNVSNPFNLVESFKKYIS